MRSLRFHFRVFFVFVLSYFRALLENNTKKEDGEMTVYFVNSIVIACSRFLLASNDRLPHPCLLVQRVYRSPPTREEAASASLEGALKRRVTVFQTLASRI